MEFLHPAMWHVALESWQWIHQAAAPCNVIRGSGMTCHWILPNFRHIRILHLVYISTHHRSRHVILHQSPKFYPNRTTLDRKKMTACLFSRWRISAILDFRGPVMGSLKSPRTLSIDTIALSSSLSDRTRTEVVLWRHPMTSYEKLTYTRN